MSRRTSRPLATEAAKVLKDGGASQIQKELAGSALSQRRSGAETSEEMASKAARALQSDRSAELTKKLAATVLGQNEE